MPIIWFILIFEIMFYQYILHWLWCLTNIKRSVDKFWGAILGESASALLLTLFLKGQLVTLKSKLVIMSSFVFAKKNLRWHVLVHDQKQESLNTLIKCSQRKFLSMYFLQVRTWWWMQYNLQIPVWRNKFSEILI